MLGIFQNVVINLSSDRQVSFIFMVFAVEACYPVDENGDRRAAPWHRVNVGVVDLVQRKYSTSLLGILPCFEMQQADLLQPVLVQLVFRQGLSDC